ncbi:HNH endonuclease signature motif containing protein [Actinoplanes sp. ATCC 53533]|uniref:HNH endonuclease n=1 Tax=Actinoplanes sp. ATCC 53533 TaxID=1288362 RepID=UPI0013152CCF
MLELVSEARRAAAVCATAPAWAVADGDLVGCLEQVWAAVQQLTAVTAHLVWQAQSRGVPRAHAATSTLVWLRQRLRVSPGVAAGLVALARALHARPVLDDAVCAGAVSAEQATAIAAMITDFPADLGREVTEEAEAALVEQAGVFDSVSLGRLGARILAHVAPQVAERREADRLDREEARARCRRGFTLSPLGNGQVRLSGFLDTSGAATVTAALDPLCHPRRDPAGARSPAQRRADALVDVCTGALRDGAGLPSQGGDPAQVVVTVPFATLTDQLWPAERPANAEPPTNAEPAAKVEPPTNAEPAANAEPPTNAEPSAKAEPSTNAEPAAKVEPAAANTTTNGSQARGQAPRPNTRISTGPHGQAGAASHGQAGAASHGQAGAASHGQAGAASHGQAGAASHGQAGAASHGQAGAASHGQASAASHSQAGVAPQGQAGTGPHGQASVGNRVGWLDTGAPISAAEARRYACDAHILPAVLGGDSQVLDLGRARRLFTGPLRRALILRDGGCCFPHCDRPARWAEGHHLIPWADGGTTTLTNACLICRRHHRLLHNDSGWQARLGPDGHPEFLPPATIDPERRPQRNTFHRRQ